MVDEMTLEFLLRNAITCAVGLMFGTSGGYIDTLLGLGMGPMVLLILFGLGLVFGISAAAQMISASVSRVAADRIAPRLAELASGQPGWYIRSRISVFLVAYAGGVLFSAHVPLEALGRILGGY